MSLNRKNDSEFQFFQKYLWGFDIKLCQEGWHRPALSLFAKVPLAFSCVLPKIACFQNFLLTPLDFCGSLSQRFMAIQLFNATATSLNCISQRCRFGQGRWQHPAAQRARKGQLSKSRHYPPARCMERPLQKAYRQLHRPVRPTGSRWNHLNTRPEAGCHPLLRNDL